MSKQEKWNERYGATGLVWSAGPNALFSELAGELSPGRALDVAAGEGRNAIWLAEQGWQVDAIDFSAVGIDKGRQIAEKRGVQLNWMVGDVCHHEFDQEAYDLVAVLFLHTSAAERSVWLPRLSAALKPGGRMIYIAHDPSNVAQGVGGPQDPALLPSISELSEQLRGFEFERAEIYQRPVGQDPGHGNAKGVALDTLIIARKR
jgi:ubiquinone/menaquinone biosynthesis C-methylase UbiE